MSLKLKITLLSFILLAGLLIVRLGFILKRSINNSTTISAITSPDDQGSGTDKGFLSSPLNKDSDGDGMPDRDEIIFGTDPNNKDTDGDGYIDGEELASGHDPLDPSSDDSSDSGSISLLSSSPNLTDRLFNLGVANLLNDSGNLDPSRISTKKFADIMASINAEATLYFASAPPKDYEIKITDNNGPETVKRYLDAITPVLEGAFLRPPSSDTGLASGSITDEISAVYTRSYLSLRALEVPSSWKDIHKRLLFSFSQLSNYFGAVSDQAINNDPVRATFALDQIQETFLSFNALSTEIANLSKSQNIYPRKSFLNFFGL